LKYQVIVTKADEGPKCAWTFEKKCPNAHCHYKQGYRGVEILLQRIEIFETGDWKDFAGYAYSHDGFQTMLEKT
jgi:hypothetical protein